jgi:tagatose 6-phosphate kinase
VILTVTLNPALDVTYEVAALRPHATHRVTAVHRRGGGKGVNVARVLTALGVDARTTGLLGGATGEQVRADLDRHAVPHDFTPISGETRRTLTVVAEGDATLFNEPGPPITDHEWRAFRTHFRELASAAQVVVLSGSLPPGVPEDAYATLATAARTARPTAAPLIVLDTGGSTLMAALAGRPDVVKPNAAELAAAVPTAPGPQAAAEELRAEGAVAVVVSLGPDGLLAVTGEGVWRCRPPRSVRGNPTGAGDAVVAALSRALHDHRSTGAHPDRLWPQALADAVALSAAAVHAPVAGEIDHDVHARLRARTTVERL